MPDLRSRVRRGAFGARAVRPLIVRARHRGLGRSDVFLASYPRSGSTWLRFVLFEALTGEPAEFGRVWPGIPSVGYQRRARALLPGGGRLIQTHERFRDGDRRAVYLVRDARAVAASEYRWHRRAGTYSGGLDRFVGDFAAGRTTPWGSWGDHVDLWCRGGRAAADRLLIVRFEDLRADTAGAVSRVLGFLGVSLDEQRIREAVVNNGLAAMRAKEDRAQARGWRSNARPDMRFVNAGSTGWTEELSADQAGLIGDRFRAQLDLFGYPAS